MSIETLEPKGLILEFLNNYTSISTRVSYLKDLKDFFNHFQELGMPKDITIQHFVRYRDFMQEQGKSTSSMNRKIASIRSLMDWYVVRGIIPSNPSKSLKLPKIVINEPTLAFTDQEVNDVLDSVDQEAFYGNLHRLILILLFNLGLRRAEIVNIKVKDIYEDRGVTVVKIRGKGGKTRTLPIKSFVQLEIDNYRRRYTEKTGLELQKEDFLLQPRMDKKLEKAMNVSTVFRAVVRYARKAGISKKVSPHSCRATVISHLLENQVSARDVADFAGHSSIQTTVGVYDKKRDQLQNSAAFRVNFGG